ncbi:diacylglycerol/polyprenol kinase family protein [Microlunatus parietis]|uniref:Dolichol kinase n=1 Tax=Microlunatus parietis TaxID=682979 RepID=A0A7Y9LC93_9ACTN|nr:hypothetical protein [Microlunatus parietis]NYE72587.1 dolichol kinase [Microlunatus parietis]
MITAVTVVTTVALLAGFLAINEVVARRWEPPPELSRKIAHVGSALLAVLSCLWLDFRWYVLIGLLFSAALLLARRYLPLRSLSSRAEGSWGDLLFGVGVALAALLADNAIVFVLAVLILGLADTAAYLVGRRWPIRTIVLGRSVGGALTFLVVAFLITLPAGPMPAAVVALGCTVTELVSPRGTDNLTVPAIAAILISALA